MSGFLSALAVATALALALCVACVYLTFFWRRK